MDYTKEQVRDYLARPNGSQLIDIAAAWEGAWQLLGEEHAAALALLVRAAKQSRYAGMINERLGDRQFLYRLLSAEDPKVRKNTARLIGALGCDQDSSAVIAALQRETVRMVRPSLLLALGTLQTREAQSVLEAYTVEEATDSSEEKHVKEEQKALMTARASYISTSRHSFRGLPRNIKAELRCADQLEEALVQELATMRIPARKLGRGRVGAQISSFKALQNVRSWRELLFPMAFAVPCTGKEIAEAAAGRLLRLLTVCHGGEPPYAYRIEIRGHDINRGELAREIAMSMGSDALVNAPSAYEAELRVEPVRDGKCHIYAKLFTLPDARFAYRETAVAASIYPATAAGIMQLAAPYFQPGARVLDPCCGSGTMLIERALYDTCGMLTGVDISSSAIRAAERNMAAADLSAMLITKNCLKFEARERYDEVICNLPFGNRVGSHETNVELYEGLLRMLPRWLKKNGIAILYTMELQLLKELLKKKSRMLHLEQCIRTEAGGLQPGIFIIRVGADTEV